MAFSELEIRRHEKALAHFLQKRRPPPYLRAKFDLAYRIEGQSVVIFEIRPVWLNPDEKQESMIAKATYVKTEKLWKVYWQRADLKWHGYTPLPKVKKLEQFLDAVALDEHACFFG